MKITKSVEIDKIHPTEKIENEEWDCKRADNHGVQKNADLEVNRLLTMSIYKTGLIFILRWFWWRINAWSEITAMFASGIISIVLKLTALGPFLFAAETGVFPDWMEYVFVVLFTSVIWLSATFLTQPESQEVLQSFYKKTQPGGPGWRLVVNKARANGINVVSPDAKWTVPSGILAMIVGCVLVYSVMFATGYWIYGDHPWAIGLTISAAISGTLLIIIWNRMKDDIL